MRNSSLLAIVIALLSAVTLQLQGCKGGRNEPNKRKPPFNGTPETYYIGEAGARYRDGALFDPSGSYSVVGVGGEGVVCKVKHGTHGYQSVKAVFYKNLDTWARDRAFAIALAESKAKDCKFIRQAVWTHRGNFKLTPFANENLKGFEKMRQAIYELVKPGERKVKSQRAKTMRRHYEEKDQFWFEVVGATHFKDAYGKPMSAGPIHPASLDIDNGNGTNVFIAYEWVDYDYKTYTENGLALDEAWGHLYMAIVAVAGVHVTGYVHNDIDRGNFVINSDGILKLTDFGMSSSKDASCSGKALFFPPEMFQPGFFQRKRDASALPRVQARDLFQVGNTMLEAILGKEGEIYQAERYGLKLAMVKKKQDFKQDLKVVIQDEKKFKKSFSKIGTKKIEDKLCVDPSRQAEVVKNLARWGLQNSLSLLDRKFSNGCGYLRRIKPLISQLCQTDATKRKTAIEILIQYFPDDQPGKGFDLIRQHVRDAIGTDHKTSSVLNQYNKKLTGFFN